MNVNRFTLPNGLRVVHHHDTFTSMVAVSVLYNVGARDEVNCTRGIAHFFEHVMFTGSPNVPDFESALQDVGASNNAWTTNDLTNFFDYGPASGLETMLMVESDRMRALSFDVKTVENQRSVVIEEFKQVCLNAPYGDAHHYLRPLVYGKNHPYDCPVIGSSIEVLEKITIDDLRQWHSKYYVPSNAVLAISGNADFDTVKRLVEKWFGSIPAGELTVRPNEKKYLSGVACSDIVTVRGSVPQPLILMEWLMDGYGTEGYFAADCISDVLSEGRSSRFHRDIVKQYDFIDYADASIAGSRGQGMFNFEASVKNGDEEYIAKTVEILIDSVQSLYGDAKVTENELQRVKNKYRSRFLFENLECLNRAINMSTVEMYNEEFGSQLDRYSALTTDILTETARNIFSSPPAILVYRPE